jgi:glycosyltransferase involved in cell wall biosynthesis
MTPKSSVPNTPQANKVSRYPVVCISHGFSGNYERGFCNGLAASGVDVTLIGSDRTDAAGLSPEVRLVNLRGSQEERRPKWLKMLNLLRYHVSLLWYLLRNSQATAHLMGLVDSPVLVGVLEGLWIRAFSRRYVMTVHNLLPHDRHTRWRKLSYGWCYRLPHCLVVHTARMQVELTEIFSIKPSRIVVMEHGIEPWPATVPPRSKTSIDANDTPQILVFGKVAPYKGIDLLLDALSTVSFQYRLLIAGACPNNQYRNELQEVILNHPFRNHIEWQDRFVTETEMESMFINSDLVALPYRHIDQSGVLFQALRFGVPILATKVGQFDQYVTSDAGEIANIPDAKNLAAALERWSSRRKAFSSNRIREIGESFLWQKTVAALSNAYR